MKSKKLFSTVNDFRTAINNEENEFVYGRGHSQRELLFLNSSLNDKSS